MMFPCNTCCMVVSCISDVLDRQIPNVSFSIQMQLNFLSGRSFPPCHVQPIAARVGASCGLLVLFPLSRCILFQRARITKQLHETQILFVSLCLSLPHSAHGQFYHYQAINVKFTVLPRLRSLACYLSATSRL
jgi:hypothetical protein